MAAAHHPHRPFVVSLLRSGIAKSRALVAAGADLPRLAIVGRDKKRASRAAPPWSVEVVVLGFNTRGEALAFQWALNHPSLSRAGRTALLCCLNSQIGDFSLDSRPASSTMGGHAVAPASQHCS